VFLSLFVSFSPLTHPPSVVALQDPPVYRGKLPSFNLFTVFSSPADRGCKPRVALELVTGRTGPRKTRAPGPFPRPAPLNGLGRDVFFRIPCPCPR